MYTCMCVFLQPPTLPPVRIRPKPVVSHPVQETTTTTAKALLVCNVLTLYIVYEHDFVDVYNTEVYMCESCVLS